LITAPGFETAFLEAWRAARDSRRAVPQAIDRVFFDVEAYCADPGLRAPGDLTDDDLVRAARRALADLDRPRPAEAPGNVPMPG
jgi:hypothetical protein